MNKQIIRSGIAAFLLMVHISAAAQPAQRHRSVTINQVVVDGKVLSADTVIIETDTTTRTVNAKEVSMELPYTKGTVVHIENTYRKVVVRPSKDNKVRLSTMAYYYGDLSYTDAQWLEKMNVHVQSTDSGIIIRSGNLTGNTGLRSTYDNYSGAQSPATPIPPTATAPVGIQNTGVERSWNLTGRTVMSSGTPARGFSTYNNQAAVFNEQGSVFYTSNLKKELIVYLPAGAGLDVTSKYADVSIDHDVNTVKATITSASLDMVNAGTVTINSTYGNISAGNVDKAIIDLTSGKLFIKNVKQLQLTTRYTKVEAASCGVLTMQSVSDDYDLDEVKVLSGQKQYGNLRIDKLTGSMNLTAASADINIRNILPAVSSVAIDNKYADIRLPVAALKNYSVVFSGQYSSVFAPFERQAANVESGTPAAAAETAKQTGLTAARGTVTSRRTNNNFTAAVGDVKGAHIVFTLACTSCNVDFK